MVSSISHALHLNTPFGKLVALAVPQLPVNLLLGTDFLQAGKVSMSWQEGDQCKVKIRRSIEYHHDPRGCQLSSRAPQEITAFFCGPPSFHDLLTSSHYPAHQSPQQMRITLHKRWPGLLEMSKTSLLRACQAFYKDCKSCNQVNHIPPSSSELRADIPPHGRLRGPLLHQSETLPPGHTSPVAANPHQSSSLISPQRTWPQAAPN